jgi:hypothetical protein
MYYPTKNIPAIVVLAALVGALVWLISPPGSHAQDPVMSAGGNSAAVTTWRPNKKDAKYVGPEACSKCHKEEVDQHATAMGKAMEPVATSIVLRANPQMTFRSGQYAYQISRKGDQSIYTVTDGTNTFSEPILYAFGQGKAGQTYLFRHKGSFYESRVSFYKELKGLDWTMGYQTTLPASLDDAPGRAMSADEARDCFACHTTGAISGTQLQLDRLTPGVTCEACHGPGGEHITEMEAKRFKNKRIFNPGNMGADEMSQEFCGSCHRSAEQVMTNRQLRGVVSLRFQPYRLFTSKGHDPDDMRLRCTSCHDPHANPVEEPAFYDAKCFACHRSGASLKSVAVLKAEEKEGRIDKACPVGQRECVSCHMPKIGVPGSHFLFTDHRIRIARPGEPFPN